MEQPSGPVSRLRWYPDRGFELDLSASQDDIILMMVAVPIPVDGTTGLRAEPVSLDTLEILFKAQVDVAGSPGQLTEATVHVTRSERVAPDGEVIALTATVEDAESGERRALELAVPVQVPADAPSEGGPTPVAADEADLDWEDDDTFEAMFKDPLTQEDPLPMAGRPARGDGDDPEDDGPDGLGRPDTATRKRVGLNKLIEALVATDDDDDLPPTDESSEVAAGPDPAPDDDDPGLSALLRLVAKDDLADETPPGAPDLTGDPGDARGLLQFLVDREELELEPGHDVDELVPGAAPIVAAPKSPDARARALSEWLFDQDAVAELYISDDALSGLLERW